MTENNWQRIETLFHAAKALNPGDREEFLDRECAGDKALRESVESLLSHTGHDDELDAVVEKAAHSLLNSKPDIAGSRIGPYQVIRELGKGGMGTVYLAERADDQYHQQVAIKLIRSGTANDEVMRRFKVERQILANLEHPNIARLLDGGTTDSGYPYLVMEFIQGEPIDVYCNQNKLNIRERLRLFIKVCSAVQYAHQKLVVHRDLKPSNLLVTPDGEPKLLDFGIAKLLEPPETGDSGVETREGTWIITPQYSSPEQVRGEPVSTVTDVYGLGIVLYELLTGRRPYGKTEKDRYSIGQAVLETIPARPSVSVVQPQSTSEPLDTAEQTGATLNWCGELQVTQLQRLLSGDLDNIALMSLRKEPERRYQSVSQFADDIERYLEDLPIIARPNSWSYRSSKFLSRHRFSSALVAALAVSIIGFGITTWVQSRQITVERDIARLEKSRAEAISGFLVQMLSSIDPDKAQGRDITVREVLDKAGQQIDQADQALHNQPGVEATIRRVIGSIYGELGILPPAQSHLEKALQFHETTGQVDQEELFFALNELSGVYHLQFKEEERLKLLERALSISRDIFGEMHQHTLGSMYNIASSHHMLGDLQKAEAQFYVVYQKRLKVLGPEHRDTLLSVQSLGIIYHWLGDFDKAQLYYRLCIDAANKVLGKKHTQSLNCLTNLGSVLEAIGEYEAAEPIIKEHIELATLVQGKNHPSTLRSMHNLADTYRGLGRFAESEALFLRTLNARKTHLGQSHIETLQTQMKLARLYRLTKQYEKAEPLVSDTVTKQTGQLGFVHPTTLIAAQELADLYHASGRIEEARQLYTSILKARETTLGANHAELNNTLLGLGTVYLKQGNSDQAEGYLLRALKLADDNPNFKAQDTRAILEQLIELYDVGNSPDKAAEYRIRLSKL